MEYHPHRRKEPDQMRQTNWHVITGAPCSGKTTVIREIEQRGTRVIHEVARSYIDEQRGKGLRLEQIKADVLQFERHILLAKIRIEEALTDTEPVFLDRGVPDSIAYYRLEGIDPAEPIAFSHRARYRQVFFFERFELLKDGVRSEDDMMAAKLNDLLLEAYAQVGYDIIRVPPMPVADRTDLVLRIIK
jgi:predicted ATPase